MTPHWSAEDRCTKPASALRHARRVRCLTHHTLMTPEPRELAGRAARSSSSTCAHHPHATRTRPTRRLSFAAQANTSASRRSAQCFGPPRCSARRPVATRVCLSCAAGLKRRSGCHRCGQCLAATPRTRRLAGYATRTSRAHRGASPLPTLPYNLPLTLAIYVVPYLTLLLTLALEP